MHIEQGGSGLLAQTRGSRLEREGLGRVKVGWAIFSHRGMRIVQGGSRARAQTRGSRLDPEGLGLGSVHEFNNIHTFSGAVLFSSVVENV